MLAKHILLGKRGEEAAEKFLLNKKYSIKEKNWRTKTSKSEIDIIAIKDNYLVIIEIKTREKENIQRPEEAVNNKKIKLLIELANTYCEMNQIDLEIRFDVISVIINKNQIKFNHIKNAFEPLF